MWIFRVAWEEKYGDVYRIGYNDLGHYEESTFVTIFTVDSMLKAMRLVNYLNGGDGTINSMIEDICGE